MQKKLLALSLGVGALLLATQHAFAQPFCARHDTIQSRLAERYGETRRSVGLAANSAVIEVYASDETGTWTITMTMPGGPTCIAAAGEAWQPVADAAPPKGDPA